MPPQVIFRAAPEAAEPREDRPAADWAVAEMRGAIAALLFASPTELDIRLLWTAGPVTHFRVNWWSSAVLATARIRRSAFVRVTRGPHGYGVRVGPPAIGPRELKDGQCGTPAGRDARGPSLDFVRNL